MTNGDKVRKALGLEIEDIVLAEVLFNERCPSGVDFENCPETLSCVDCWTNWLGDEADD